MLFNKVSFVLTALISSSVVLMGVVHPVHLAPLQTHNHRRKMAYWSMVAPF